MELFCFDRTGYFPWTVRLSCERRILLIHLDMLFGPFHSWDKTEKWYLWLRRRNGIDIQKINCWNGKEKGPYLPDYLAWTDRISRRARKPVHMQSAEMKPSFIFSLTTSSLGISPHRYILQHLMQFQSAWIEMCCKPISHHEGHQNEERTIGRRYPLFFYSYHKIVELMLGIKAFTEFLINYMRDTSKVRVVGERAHGYSHKTIKTGNLKTTQKRNSFVHLRSYLLCSYPTWAEDDHD